MCKYLLALVMLAVLTPDSSACDQAQRRGGPLARVFAAQRAVLRIPARVATAPLRVMSRPRTASYGYSSSYYSRTTTYSVSPPVVVVPVPVPPRK